ncbi:DoxX-like family protein [Acinetobacter sp. WCHAc010034]|uniref:DoxX-like family protein n=1 Tax=Acinetobacter sp. WCHAc010034 TaxID=1879049 RepID=UPI000B315325|nr:DoxX-like family protein [Acinetobacter sp. WCHAc010034]
MNLKRTLQPPIRTIQLSLAALWIYQGLVPKILFQAQDELRIWLLQGFDAGLALRLMQLSGAAEMMFGCLLLMLKPSRLLHGLNILAMLGLSLLIIALEPLYFSKAFNPFVMNGAMAALSACAIQLLRIAEAPRPAAES